MAERMAQQAQLELAEAAEAALLEQELMGLLEMAERVLHQI
jgi:hypothetical protein